MLEKDSEIERLKQWVNDLQSGMYVNCVYCGHRYGPSSEVPVAIADVLKQHIEQCSEHPMSLLKQKTKMLVNSVKKFNRLVGKIAMGDSVETAYNEVEDILEQFNQL